MQHEKQFSYLQYQFKKSKRTRSDTLRKNDLNKQTGIYTSIDSKKETEIGILNIEKNVGGAFDLNGEIERKMNII